MNVDFADLDMNADELPLLVKPKEPVENLMGLGNPRKITKRGGVRSHRFIIELHDVALSCRGIPVLKNGHSSKLISTENTSSFDSLLSVFAVAYCDYEEIKIFF